MVRLGVSLGLVGPVVCWRGPQNEKNDGGGISAEILSRFSVVFRRFLVVFSRFNLFSVVLFRFLRFLDFFILHFLSVVGHIGASGKHIVAESEGIPIILLHTHAN